jgi:hypothetical protein
MIRSEPCRQFPKIVAVVDSKRRRIRVYVHQSGERFIYLGVVQECKEGHPDPAKSRP